MFNAYKYSMFCPVRVLEIPQTIRFQPINIFVFIVFNVRTKIGYDNICTLQLNFFFFLNIILNRVGIGFKKNNNKSSTSYKYYNSSTNICSDAV